MRTWIRFSLSMILAGTLWGAVRTEAQTPSQQPGYANSGAVTTVNEAIDRLIARERDEIAVIRSYKPITETYVQDMRSDPQLGIVPIDDHYFLGQADLSTGVGENSFLENNNNKKKKEKMEDRNSHKGGPSSSYDPEGFLRMIYVDTEGFDREHYTFDYGGREFLGEVRCLVFDVTPLAKSGKGRFYGRIWVEDQDFTIVRFNGVYTSGGEPTGFTVHFDSWRLNLQPGLWLPAFVFSQESDSKNSPDDSVRFKAQTRLWGYSLKSAGSEAALNDRPLGAAPSAAGGASAQTDSSPIDEEREWQHQAEVNVLDRLERIGLLAPPGEVDKVLETVVNNLEVTNNLDIEPDVHCRVLLTGTLESFSIGHTIVMSRGLLDVLPDEASLATMLAQELAAIVVMKPSTDQWGFNDTTNVTADQALSRFSFKATPAEEEMANQKAIEFLKHSPYQDKLGTAALFLKQLQADSSVLPSLINAHLGNSVALSTALLSMGPPLQADNVDQIAALPLGARVKVDPWSDRVELVKAKAVALHSAREKMPFEVTPFMPFLTRYHD
ncbi:MAG: hypothetical protein ACLQMT_13855 [Candidatus Acidiferrales bacterium]